MDRTNKRKVLVVDDEPAVRELVRKILGKDYSALEARNGVEAVDMTCSYKPDIILMDMMMPAMDGLAGLLSWLKYQCLHKSLNRAAMAKRKGAEVVPSSLFHFPAPSQ